jgi:anti-sigma-K factor RskA
MTKLIIAAVALSVFSTASAAEFNPTHRLDKLEASTGLALKPTSDLDQTRSREFRWDSSAGFWGSLVGLAITATIVILAVNAADKDNNTPYDPMEHSSH